MTSGNAQDMRNQSAGKTDTTQTRWEIFYARVNLLFLNPGGGRGRGGGVGLGAWRSQMHVWMK